MSRLSQVLEAACCPRLLAPCSVFTAAARTYVSLSVVSPTSVLLGQAWNSGGWPWTEVTSLPRDVSKVTSRVTA